MFLHSIILSINSERGETNIKLICILVTKLFVFIAGDPTGNVVTSDKSRRPAKSVVTNQNKVPLHWIYHAQFSIDPIHWSKLRTIDTIDSTYPEYFIPILNKNEIACVLKARGPYILKQTNEFVLRFRCTHDSCPRQYKVFECQNANFKIYRNNEDALHTTERCRPVRGIKRKIVTHGMKNLTPSDYLMFCNNGICEKLLKEGHLQDSISSTTANQIHSEALQISDFDKDDIIDLLKMKILADLQEKKDSETEVYIRRITLDPFDVLMYTKKQLQLMKQMGEEDDKLTMHFDAT